MPCGCKRKGWNAAPPISTGTERRIRTWHAACFRCGSREYDALYWSHVANTGTTRGRVGEKTRRVGQPGGRRQFAKKGLAPDVWPVAWGRWLQGNGAVRAGVSAELGG